MEATALTEQTSHQKIRSRLARGECAFGTFLKISSLASVEAVGLSGFDFCIIDLEHGPFSFERAENMVRAAELVGLSAIIRTFDTRPHTLVRALDTGCEGVLVPNLTSRREAEAVVRGARFHPLGGRGMDPFARAARYGTIAKEEYFARSNEETLVGVMIEGTEGLRNLPEILEVKGIDLVFVGPYDLSQSVGVPGQVQAPAVQDRVAEIVAAARDAGVTVGIYADGVSDACRWCDVGIRCVATSVDVRILLDGCRAIVDALANR